MNPDRTCKSDPDPKKIRSDPQQCPKPNMTECGMRGEEAVSKRSEQF